MSTESRTSTSLTLAEQNWPAGVVAAVSQIGMPETGFKMPTGFPMPSPAMIALLIASRKP
jgi:hypothetical protein